MTSKLAGKLEKKTRRTLTSIAMTSYVFWLKYFGDHSQSISGEKFSQ